MHSMWSSHSFVRQTKKTGVVLQIGDKLINPSTSRPLDLDAYLREHYAILDEPNEFVADNNIFRNIQR